MVTIDKIKEKFTKSNLFGIYHKHRYRFGRELLQGEFDLLERERIVRQFDRKLHERFKSVSDTISDYYYECPIIEDTVLLVGLGKNVRGSMQYILNELNGSTDFEGFHIYVRASEETESIVQGYIQRNDWSRTQTVVDNKEYSRLLESVKYLISEVDFPGSWVWKPGQVYINIWHGTPLKKLGLAKKSKNVHKDGIKQRNFIDAEYLMYPNEYTRRNMLESYKVADLMTGRILMLGYPRTGGMLEVAKKEHGAFRNRLAEKGQRIYVYMPTWKNYLTEEQVVAETVELLDYLDATLHEDQLLYVNLHHKVSDSITYSKYRHIRKFPSDVDSYALLAVSDALITDYSSVFFDYLALRRQIILYCADYELYCKKRGTYMDLMELPFDKARTKEEVLEALSRGKTYDDTEVYESFCKYDSERNAASLCKLISGRYGKGDLELQEIPGRKIKKHLIFSERFEQSPNTEALSRLSAGYERAVMQIYYSGEMFAIDSNKKSAYPLLKKDPVIGTVRNMHLSRRGTVLLREYKEGRMEFDKAMCYLRYDYALAACRMYGKADFDTVVIYDVIDPELILALSSLNAHRILFLTEEMLGEIQAGNRFLKDAVYYVARRSDSVYAFGESAVVKARRIWPQMDGVGVFAEQDEIEKLLVNS